MQQIPVDVGRNFLSGLTGGMQAGQAMRQSQDNNQLRNIFATQDINDPAVQQQIMGLDPQTGMQLQNQTFQRQQQAEALRYNRGRDALADERFERGDARAQKTFEMQIEEQARLQSAAENQAAADAILQNLTPAVVAHRQGPEQFEAWKAGNVQVLQQAGIDPATLTYDAFPSAAAKLKGAADMFANAAKIVPDAPKPEYGFNNGQYYDQNDPQSGAAPIPNFIPKEQTGFTVETLPDGTTRVVQGPVSGLNPDGSKDVGKSGGTTLDGMEIGARDTLERLKRIESNLTANPQILNAQTLEGQVKTMGLTWKDFITGDLSSDQAEYLVEVTSLRGDVLENVNATIKEITGAAMGVEEAKRIIATLPNVDDGPAVFEAKLNRALKSTRMAVARYNYWRKNGLEGDVTGVASLSEMPGIMKDRAQEVYQEELANGDPAGARDRAKARLIEEFGVE